MLEERSADLLQTTSVATHSHQTDQSRQPQDHLTEEEPGEVTETIPTTTKRKTLKELDDELMQKMAGLGGDVASMEFEDGKPVSMKRGVRENMFRYI